MGRRGAPFSSGSCAAAEPCNNQSPTCSRSGDAHRSRHRPVRLRQVRGDPPARRRRVLLRRQPAAAVPAGTLRLPRQHRPQGCRRGGRRAQRIHPRRSAQHGRDPASLRARRPRAVPHRIGHRTGAALFGNAAPAPGVVAYRRARQRNHRGRGYRDGTRTARAAERNCARDRHQRAAAEHAAPLGAGVRRQPARQPDAVVRVLRLQGRHPDRG